MNEKHIIEILESVPFASLNESEHATIRSHVASCAACERAYKVAVVSSSLLVERRAEAIEPPPFFHTRVLAALRERQNEGPVWQRLWRTAGALVSSMAAAVLLLGALTFMAPEQSQTEATASSVYSIEGMMLDDAEVAQDVSDAQVLSTLYASEEDER